MPLAIFSDFDGTLSDCDTIDLVVETFIGPDYKKSVSSRLHRKEMTIREALTEEFAKLRLAPDEIRAFLLERVRIDPHLPALIRFARRHDIPFTILSSGVDVLILPLLEAAGCDAPVRCNRLLWDSELHHAGDPSLTIEFLDDSDNGHDKAAELRAARQTGYQTIYMGDGLSDVSCAAEADVLFARRHLERYCREHGIAYRPLGSCADVLAYLEENVVVSPALQDV